jgi:hypothetical protein
MRGILGCDFLRFLENFILSFAVIFLLKIFIFFCVRFFLLKFSYFPAKMFHFLQQDFSLFLTLYFLKISPNFSKFLLISSQNSLITHFLH